MTTTAPITETGSPGRRWLDVAIDPALAPDTMAQLAAAATGLLAVVVKQDEASTAAESDDALVAQLDQELAEARQLAASLEQQVEVRQAKIDAALEAMKKSTAKLTLEVRAILEVADPPPSTAVEPSSDPLSEDTVNAPGQPARDADVEEWRAYARLRGVDPEGLNRSQIRTALGISNEAVA